MDSWRNIGPHRYCTEDRLLHWEAHGAVLPDQCHEFLHVVDTLGARRLSVFIVLDQREALPVSPAVRRIVVDYLRTVRPALFCGFVRSPVAQRAINQLIIGAARLLYGYELRHANFDSVEAALTELRARRDGENGGLSG